MSSLQSFRRWAASSTLAHVAFAFIFMGAWAMFANRAHPLPVMLAAGLVQGIISGLLTLVLKKFLEWLIARLRGTMALIAPPVVTASSILALLTLAHKLAGTPEILATIAVPWTVSTTYAALYNFKLWRERA